MTAPGVTEPGGPDALADLVHELNNVLSAVLGYAEIVHADAANGTVEERDAVQILAATRRAIQLTDELAALISGDAAAPRADAPSKSEPDDAA